MNFEIYFSFPVKPLSYMNKNSEQKLKYLNNRESFKGKVKSVYYHFVRASCCQKFSQT